MLLINSLKNQWKLIRRDIILIALVVFVVYLAIVLRFLLPWLNGYLAEQGFLPNQSLHNSLSHYYPLILSFLVLYTGAILGGAIFGFLILTDKDDNTLKAMLVTPISPKNYINSRIMACAGITFFIILFIFYVVNLKLLTFTSMVLIALGGSLTAPIIMLFLAVLADSKLQGMSFSKFLSFGGLLIIVSWFVKEPLQWLFGLIPPYWISKAYWTALDGSQVWYLYLVLGIILQVGVIILLSNQFISISYWVIRNIYLTWRIIFSSN